MKSYWKILLIIAFFAAILFSGLSAFAVEETKPPPTYTLLQPLPGMNQTMPVKAILPAYLAVLFKFMLVLAGALAVLMIVFSGIMYITSGGNANQVEKAKSRIWSAIGGLVLAVSAYLILYTINPNLVNLDLGIQPIEIKAPPQCDPYCQTLDPETKKCINTRAGIECVVENRRGICSLEGRCDLSPRVTEEQCGAETLWDPVMRKCVPINLGI